MSNRARASIDLTALRYNYDVVRRLVGNDRKIIAMIKADAYGHGLTKAALALSNADLLGVANLDEAVMLRDANIHTPIVVMTGFLSEADLPLFLQHELSPVMHHESQLTILENAKLSKPLEVWLKIDTGMHRLGFSVDRAMGVLERIRRCDVIRQPVNIMTHLADADNANQQMTKMQLSVFSDVTQDWAGIKSVSNSAGILAYQESLEDVVRPGIMLYGVSPFFDRTGLQEGLKPVMQLTSKVIAVKNLRQGDKIGYGCTWECPEDMPMGVVGIGYGDGYPRHAKNGTPVLVNGLVCSLVGRVSMDMITVDLRHQPNVTIGDEVVLWGHDLPIEKIAAFADTIPYELLCQLTQRVEFVYSDQA